MRQLFGIGYKGTIIAIAAPEDLKHMDVMCKEGQHPLLAPIAEVSLEVFPQQYFFAVGRGGALTEDLRSIIEPMYRDPVIYGAKKYGPFGDVLFVTLLDKDHSQSMLTPALLSGIAPKAFHKPALAADLLVVVGNYSDDPYFVGIRRKNEPGIGQPATIGGFLDIKGHHLDSPLQTILHEGPEEASVNIFQKDGAPLTERALLSLKTQEVSVVLRNAGPFTGWLKYLGVVPTGKEEELPSGQKRVYWTFGYLLYVEVPDVRLDETSVTQMFCAGDDAESIYVRKLPSTQEDFPPFYSTHHCELYRRAIIGLMDLPAPLRF